MPRAQAAHVPLANGRFLGTSDVCALCSGAGRARARNDARLLFVLSNRF